MISNYQTVYQKDKENRKNYSIKKSHWITLTLSVSLSRFGFPIRAPIYELVICMTAPNQSLCKPPINTAPNINKSSLWDESKSNALPICIKSGLIWLAMSSDRNVRQDLQDVVCLRTEFISSDQNLFLEWKYTVLFRVSYIVPNSFWRTIYSAVIAYIFPPQTCSFSEKRYEFCL